MGSGNPRIHEAGSLRGREKARTERGFLGWEPRETEKNSVIFCLKKAQRGGIHEGMRNRNNRNEKRELQTPVPQPNHLKNTGNMLSSGAEY